MRFQKRQYRSPRLLKRRRKLLYIKFGAAVVAIVTLIGLASWLSFNKHVVISSIEVVGNSVLTEEEVIALVEKKLGGKYLLLFSRENIFLYPRAGIKESILFTYKRVREVDVKTTGFTSTKITIKERSPYALWCDKSGDCYFLDNEGYIFANAPQFTGTVFFVYRGALSSGASPIGRQFLTKGEFQRLDTMRLLLADSESITDAIGNPSMMVIQDEKDVELDFDSGGRLLFMRSGEENTLLANVESLFNSDIFEDTDLSLLDYIDFRFGNKAYYRFK